MRKSKFFIAILVMVVATLVSVAIVSCKKEDTVAPTGQHAAKAAFTPPQVDDMNAYLKAFKQKMQSAAKGDDEALSLDEAAWHLSSVANYDFGHINVEFDDVRFDTIFIQTKVTDGNILLCDIEKAYQEIHSEITKLQSNTKLENMHFRFIGIDISDNGQTVISMIQTFNNSNKNLFDHTWHFSDIFAAYSACETYFDYYGSYKWDTTAVDTLKAALRGVWNYEFPIEDRVYCTYSRTLTPDFLDHIDQYDSPFGYDSRIFNTVIQGTYLYFDEMCYALDSYLGLGQELAVDDEIILDWGIGTESRIPDGSHLTVWYHIPSIKYGVPSTVSDPPVND